MYTYYYLFWLLFAARIPAITGDVCLASHAYKRTFTNPLTNRTLVGGQMTSFTAKTERDCETACHMVHGDQCYMFNFCRVSKLCQLLMYAEKIGSRRIVNTTNCAYRVRECDPKSCYQGSQCFLIGNSNDTCLCPPPLNTTSCTSEGWLKVNRNPVCIGAKNDSFGTVIAPYFGKILNLKLVHLSGGVSSSAAAPGHWGTSNGTLNDTIELFLTGSSNVSLTPPPGYPLLAGNTSYVIANVTNMSPELVFPNFTTPLRVTQGYELRVWLGEDLTNGDEDDNEGITCADVYILYQH